LINIQKAPTGYRTKNAYVKWDRKKAHTYMLVDQECVISEKARTHIISQLKCNRAGSHSHSTEPRLY
jgi:hypothetical protein